LILDSAVRKFFSRESLVQLAATHIGEGFPLLILHGLFGSSGNWTSIARQLSRSFEVFTLDHRNHGLSPRSTEMSYDVMAEDVAEFMDGRGIARAHLLGHSMGGKTVMRLAQQAPERLARLVVVDIAPGATEAGHEGMIRALRSVDLSQVSKREEVGRALAGDIPERRVRQFLLTNLRREPDGRLVWKLNLEAIERNYSALIGPLPNGHPADMPALFIRGGRSNHLRVEDEEDIRRRFPHASFVTIAEAGHWVHAEAPGQFLRAVTRFLGAAEESA
jgi:esterase